MRVRKGKQPFTGTKDNQIKKSTPTSTNKLNKNILRERMECLKKAQEASNERTSSLVRATHGSTDEELSEALSASQSSSNDDENISASRRKKRLRERQRGEQDDILAYKKLRSTAVNSGSSHAANDVSRNNIGTNSAEFQGSSTRNSQQNTLRKSKRLEKLESDERIRTLANVQDVQVSTVEKTSSDHTSRNNFSKRNHKRLNKSRSTENRDTQSNSPNSDNHEQLFGKNCGEQMHSIGNGFLCKSQVLVNAVGRSKNPRQCCRKILTGVFKLNAILNCTLTGKKFSPLTRKRESLYGPAVRAITSYSKKWVKKKKWQKMTTAQLRGGIRRKICLIRSEYYSAVRQNKEYFYGDY